LSVYIILATYRIFDINRLLENNYTKR